jgi:hypothetical protein
MKKLLEYTEGLEGERDLINRLLGEWTPRAFTLTEKDQERDLYAFLRARLPDISMSTQYGIAKGKADIVITDSHVIELKLAFSEDSVSEFDRCIGQLERYRQKWVVPDRGAVYLVVVGDSDPDFREMLHSAVEHANHGFMGTWFFLIEKRPARHGTTAQRAAAA